MMPHLVPEGRVNGRPAMGCVEAHERLFQSFGRNIEPAQAAPPGPSKGLARNLSPRLDATFARSGSGIGLNCSRSSLVTAVLNASSIPLNSRRLKFNFRQPSIITARDRHEVIHDVPRCNVSLALHLTGHREDVTNEPSRLVDPCSFSSYPLLTVSPNRRSRATLSNSRQLKRA